MQIIGYVAVFVISLAFVSGALYYMSLYIFMRLLIRNNGDLWDNARKVASRTEIKLRTSYKLLMRRDVYPKLREPVRRWAIISRLLLFVSFSLFMIILACGLYISVNK